MEVLEIQRQDKETILSYADWIFPRYFGDTSWGISPTFKCNDCERKFGYALPTNKLFLIKRKMREFLVCKEHIQPVEHSRTK